MAIPFQFVFVGALTAALVTACSDKPGAADTAASATATDAADTSGVAQADLGGLDLGGADVSAGTCPGAPGCACVGHDECASGACAWDPLQPGGLSCAGACGSGCPAGQRCVAKGGAEGLQVCVPAAGKACNPCSADADCDSLGISGLCVDRGDDGRFCGIPCVAGACPAGLACKPALTVTGVKADLCQPVDTTGGLGACPCSPAAKAFKLATVCAIAAKDSAGKVLGTCKGTRACGAAGLSPCDAKAGAPETCNGKDDDCDGQTDNGAPCDDGDKCVSGRQCVAGVCTAGTIKTCDDQNDCSVDTCDPKTGNCGYAYTDGAACSDGNPCTADEKCKDGVCAGGVAKPCPCATTADCAAQEDGNLCNGTLYCEPTSKLCVLNPASVVVCADDGAACTDNLCKTATGTCEAVNLADGTTCSDGLAWTVGDVCEKGACVAGPDTKLCKATADCAKYDDGDLCNGALFCNKATGVCQTNPKTVVYCPTVGDTACAKNACEPKTGACATKPVADNTPCEDGNLCSTGEACVAGVCTASAGGGNTCACQKDADCTKWDDGDLCNGTLYCNLAKAVCAVNAATVIVCPTVNDGPCSASLCQKATGTCATQAKADGTACDADGSPCSPFDACKGGVCVKDTAEICQCKQDADCAAYEDGDACNGTLYCDKAKNKCVVNPKTVVACPPSVTPCQANLCSNGACALVAANAGATCDDGDAKTSGDVCAAGVCKGKATVVGCGGDGDCPDDGDGNPCTALGCQGGACKPALPIGVSCADDGNACTSDACNGGLCQHNPLIALPCKDDGDPCTLDQCDVLAACAHPPALAGAKCGDDGNACTDDTCDGAGKCVHPLAKLAAPCASDGLVCTADVCDGKGNCVHNVTGACLIGGVCVATGLNPLNPCQKCIGGQKLWTSVGGACDDGNACTVGDVCGGAACLPGKATDCEDGNPCTKDACEGATGCAHVALPAGATCGTSQWCDGKGACGSAPPGMAKVEGGVFWMGCNVQKDASCNAISNEKPQHKVAVSTFWLDIHEVTLAEYAQCVAASTCSEPMGSFMPMGWDASKGGPQAGKEKLPMNGVAWMHANAYCKWRGGVIDSIKASAWSLPTEAQWEYAARGPCEKNGATPANDAGCKAAMRVFPWGDAVPTCELAVFDDGSASGCAGGELAPVGSKPAGAGPFGHRDLAGSVDEWVNDWFDSTYYSISPGVDPTGPAKATGMTANRPRRGGSYWHTKVGLRSSARNAGGSNAPQGGTGFRCARAL
ncbi:MAG: formylglycine-generating enzyme family protein [Deltaproteobacteria bacterium]|nr:formylglycine-generating enzyme family protein [Deltaproteobacteria bacterium]